MISSIVLTGTLKDTYKGKFRLIETHNNDPLNPNKDIISLIPLAYWSKDIDNVLFNIANNTNVVIKGHIETDKEIGLFIVVETMEVNK